MSGFDPARHTVVNVEVLESASGRGANRRIVGWFVRVTYTGDEFREFRGERSEVEFFEIESEARAAAAMVKS